MKTLPFWIPLIALALPAASSRSDDWIVDTREQWETASASAENLRFEEGVAVPEKDTAVFRSQVRTFETPRSAKSLVLEQSPIWQNWNPIDNVGPSNLADAPVLLCKEPGNYWIFGRYGGRKRGGKGAKGQAKEKFVSEPASLEGFDIPLRTTPYPNQYDAPGGLEKGLGGYHAWQSRDMVNWVHHGPVTEGFSRWVTTAEFADGKTYIYYDYPNDQDPHLYIDEDLSDGKPGKNMGLAVPDPSHGSDCGVIRDEDGRFHVIFEDWSPINASRRSWDSPLAGHAVSEDGIDGFRFLDPAVDNRTEPTGETKTYKHPHWAREDPDNYPTNIAEYEVHEPEQEAYGDWAATCVGGQYYLFGDYDPAGGHQMSVGWFTSPSLDEPFTWCDKIGNGHPDPDVGFAEGKFYLVTQQQKDYVSPGPWVESVEARAGVDVDGDGEIDEWSEWQEVSESYRQREGFAKQIEKDPARLDLSGLPEGRGFAFEFRVEDETENRSRPILDRVTLEWK